MNKLDKALKKVEDDHMANFHTPEFNVFKFEKAAGRCHVIELMTCKAFKDLELIDYVTEHELL